MIKKTLKLLALLVATLMPLTFISCGGDDEPTPNPEPVDPTIDQAMSPLEQKQYLEKVALEFMDQMPASDFRTIADLATYFKDTYGEDYDWDDVGEWGEDIIDDLTKALGTTTTETETENYGSSTYVYNYIYNNYKAVLMASNFTGHWTAKNGHWSLEQANDLQFIFNDKSGNRCVIKLETRGNTTKVHAFNIDDWYDYDWSSQGNKYIRTEYYDRTNYIIGVPEEIILTLTQGSTELIKVNVKINLSSLTDEEFDISKGAIDVTANVTMHNGYKIVVSQVKYTGNKSASASFEMTKNGKKLVTMGLSSDVRDLPSVNVSAFSEESFDVDDYDTDNTTGKITYSKVDILGKVQIQGTIDDIHKFVDYLDLAEDNDDNENQYKSYINQANALTDVNLFYDGSNVKQATVKLEPFADENWYGYTYWVFEPVLYFYDGSSYSTFEAFFNDRDFKNTINTFKGLTNSYAYLIDETINW